MWVEKENQDKDPGKQQMPGVKCNMMVDRVHRASARLNQYKGAVWERQLSDSKDSRSLRTCSDFKTANAETDGQTSKAGVLREHKGLLPR